MARELKFHADFASVVISHNGTPLALHGEVEVTVKRPTKLSVADNAVWNALSKETAVYLSAEQIPGDTR